MARPASSAARPGAFTATALVLFGELLVLRLLFALRRPDLVRDVPDVLAGALLGLVGDVGLALVLATVAALLALASRLLAVSFGSLAALALAALAAVETEYFAWSHNRLDSVFLAYLREWRTLAGSVGGQTSPAFLVVHALVAIVAIAALRKFCGPARPPPVRLALAPFAGCALVLVPHLQPRHAASWFGAVVQTSPEHELVRTALRDETRAAPPGPAIEAALEVARSLSNPFGAKAFDAPQPLSHSPERFPEGVFTIPAKRPNVLFVLLEGMPANVLAISGATGGLTPELDRLATRGLAYRNFFANGAHTPRAIDASLCSIWPRLVGAPLSRAQPRMPLRCVSSILRDAGYSTAFVHGGFESFENRFEFLGRIGFQQLRFFDAFAEGVLPRTNGGWGTTDAETFAEALRWLDARDHARPFLLTVLTISNHHPFHVPDPELETAHDDALRPNDTMRYADRELGRFIRQLEERRLLEDTVIFVLGDHGLTRANAAAAGDAAVHEQVLARLNVPLIVLTPPGTVAPRVVDRTASQVDLVPTALHLAGLAVPNHAAGSSLAWTLPPHDRDLPVFVHDLYSELVARIEPGRLTLAEIEPGRTPFGAPTAEWRREQGTPRATPVATDEVRTRELRALVDAVNHLYATESWWSAAPR